MARILNVDLGPRVNNLPPQTMVEYVRCPRLFRKSYISLTERSSQPSSALFSQLGLAIQILFLTSSMLSANVNANPYPLGSNKLRRVTRMKQIRIFLLSALLIFTGGRLGTGHKERRSRERASGATGAAACANHSFNRGPSGQHHRRAGCGCRGSHAGR